MFACLHAPGNSPLLIECAAHFSPLIEETPPDTVVFDIRGLRRIHGSLEQLAQAIRLRMGINARLAMAGNPDAAIHAAKGFRETTIIPAGKEAETLAPLPLFLLGGSPEFARTVNLWGLRTFGEFAALPPLGVSARLGEEGVELQRLAQGAGSRQLRLRTEPVVFREARELEEAIDLLEPLLFLLSQMVRDLCERLHFHGQATNEVRLRLQLEKGAEHRTVLRLPAPMLNAKILIRLLHLELNQRPPMAPVEKVFLELAPVEPRTAQHGLFVPLSPEPEKLEITLARIRGLVGVGNVGAPAILATHRPDSFQMRETELSREQSVALRPKLALRRFRPPCFARVLCTGEGQPAHVTSAAAGGVVVACAGPWRTAGDWWQDAWDRSEWDVEIRNVGVFRIFLDCRRNLWFLDGNYD